MKIESPAALVALAIIAFSVATIVVGVVLLWSSTGCH